MLDTTAFLAGLPLHLPLPAYTTSLVVEEVKDFESKLKLDIALSIHRVTVRDPSPQHVRTVIEVARRVGEHGSLSETDVSVLALAHQLIEEGYKVILVTDDYAVQNVAAHMSIDYRPLRTMGIREPRSYIYMCPACGYVSTKPGEKRCPRCGTKLVKAPLRRAGRRVV